VGGFVIMAYLLFDTDDLLQRVLQARLKSAGDPGAVVLVKPGEAYRELGGGVFTVRPGSDEDHRELVAALRRAQQEPRRVVHLWAGKSLFDEGRELGQAIDRGVLALFHLSRALLAPRPTEAIRLLYPYWSPPGAPQPQHAAVAAFARTVRLECPKLLAGTVEIESDARTPAAMAAEALEVVVRELGEGGAPAEVRYSGGKRFARRLEELSGDGAAAHPAPGPLPLTEQGTYVVTGGFGALGLLFAEHLIRRARARVVLVGRSEPNAAQAARLRELEALGSEVIAMRADVSKRDEALALIDRVRGRCGGIHGVIHGAGVLRDALLVKKTPAEVREVLAPKVFGTLHLDEATRDDQLDCFVLFSSIAAVLGNLGQCDYAYANAFMDGFAAWREGLRAAGRRAGRTLSINWPLWESGGMRVDEQTRKMVTGAMGMQLLSDASGLDAFADALAGPHPQVLVVEGDRDKVKRLLGLGEPPRPAAEPRPPAPPGTAAAGPQRPALPRHGSRGGDEVEGRLQRDLVVGLTKILKVSEADVDVDADMSNFGFDSITFTTFGNDINKTFRIDVTPVVFFEYATIRSLAKHLSDEFREPIAAYYGAAASSAAPAPAPAAEARAAAPAGGEIRTKSRLLAAPEPGPEGPRAPAVAEPIAVIGMYGVMPQSEDLDAFWRHLSAGHDLISEIPKDRWDWAACFGDPFRESNKTNVRWGGFIPDVDKFDALFFGISPREAALMDPQQRILLEVVWRAIEDAGYKVSELSAARTGLFAGVGGIDYHDLMIQGGGEIQAHSVTGTMHSVLVNRISYLLNLRGPSEPVETACSSTLVAIHRAVEAIRNGDCELALAGGVHVMLGPGVHIGLSKAGMLCEDGRCKTFDRSANGYVRGEGAGAILLKPLSRAEADGDHVYGVIRGTATNHGGKVNSLTTPNPNMQAEVIIQAMERAGVSPATIGYIETHGTGTALGDPIEINGLKKAFKHLYKQWSLPVPTRPHCGLGSVKTNIGHLEFVSGLAGAFKILLALRHGRIPPTIHFKELNPYIQLEAGPFHIVTADTVWEPLRDEAGRAVPRRAGVSSFGFGGVNAHVVFEEHAPAERRAAATGATRLAVLSARSEERLRAYARRLADALTPVEAAPVAPAAPSVGPDVDAVRQGVVRRLAELLGIGEDALDPDDALRDCCDDPLVLRELDRALRDRYGVAPDVELLAPSSTLRAIALRIGGAIARPAEGTARPPEAPPGPGTLDEIVYTLQVGREDMEERLAIEVASVAELAERLRDFADGRASIERSYRGNARDAKSRAEVYEGEEGQAFIESLVQNGRLSRLARLWASGVAIPWTLLYPEGRPGRVSLPTYPFARERHWLPDAEAGDLGAGRGEVARLHPLLDRNTSTLHAQRFTSRWSGREFFLEDHVVLGSKVLPGVAALEMARAGGALAAERPVRRIEGVRWLAPLVVDGEPVEVELILTPAGTSVAYEVSTANAEQARTLHAQGRLVFAGDAPALDVPAVDLAAIQARCPAHLDGAEVYRRFEQAGIAYGASFRSVQEIWRGDGEALSRLALAARLEPGLGDWVLHPALLDGALHTAVGLLDPDELAPDVLLVPFAAAAVDVLGPCTRICHAHVRRSARPTAGAAGTLTFDVQLLDEAGHGLATIDELAVRAYRPGARAKAPASRLTTLIFRSAWKTAERPSNGAPHTAGGSILILADRLPQSTLDALTRALGRHGGELPVIVVGRGELYAADGRTVNPDEPADYRRLIGELAERGLYPRKVLHLWSLSGAPDPAPLGLHSMLYLSQALLGHKPGGVRVVYAYPDGAGPAHAAVGGLARTIRMEDPRLVCKTVALEVDAAPLGEQAIDALVEELEAGDDVEIRRTSGGRRVRTFERIALEAGEPALREGGVYLITGGAGKLGLLVARSLAGERRPRIVLAGRSEPSAAVEEELRSLASSGAEAVYLQADVSRRDDVERLVAEIRARFGGLHGIVHAAGVLEDGLVQKKTPAAVARVFSPKALGARHLDELTTAEPLDFFVLFSSLAAVTGNVGQCDYAAANAYLDAFAASREELRRAGRRRGRTLSVNWPLWEDGGMGRSPEVRERLAQFGLHPLPSDEGWRALLRGLGSEEPQIVVLHGEAPLLEGLLAARREAPRAPAATASAAPAAPAKGLRERMVGYLKQKLAEALSLPVEKIREDERLDAYGIDSIMVVNLNTLLEKDFGRVPATIFFEYRTVSELAGYFVEQHAEQAARLVGPAEAPPPPDPGRSKRNGVSHGANGASASPPLPASRFMPALPAPAPAHDEDIAIIGIAGRYPMAATLDAFWENLAAGRSCISEIPATRWDNARIYAPERGRRDKVYTRWGGFLDDVDQFDPLFFNISPREAEILDPQERLFLETAWQAIEDAGYTPEALGGGGRRVGVFAGVMYGEYQFFGVTETLKGQLTATSSSYASIANRVSYFFDFRGPSLAVDTMCSSSLTTIHLACEAIRSGGCVAALAGGVNLSLHPNKYIMLSQAGFAASDGRCRSFGEGGDGYVPGEGVGAVVLKSLSRALADGDHIHAVIKAGAINHGGRANGYTVPNPVAQFEVVHEALERSGLAAETIGYVEAHGTGTSLGDPIEIAGLTRAFREHTQETGFIPIGSVKSSIGHLEAAAGIAAVTKVVLQMRHRQLAPSLHAEVLNPRIDFERSPFYVQRELAPWPSGAAPDGAPRPRRAGISSFGAGGSNAHFILEEPPPPARAADAPGEAQLFVFSAPTAKRLRPYLARMAEHFAEAEGEGTAELADVAYTLQVGRRAFAARLAVVASSRAELLEALRTVLSSPHVEIDVGAHPPGDRIQSGRVEAEQPEDPATGDLLARRDLRRLAHLWTRGHAIPWRELHRGARRIPLPGVVFERRRCWITPAEAPAPPPAHTNGDVAGDAVTREILELLRENKITEAEAQALLHG
jgi:acyl transferase domain-containing protein/acyl carrier protein